MPPELICSWLVLQNITGVLRMPKCVLDDYEIVGPCNLFATHPADTLHAIVDSSVSRHSVSLVVVFCVYDVHGRHKWDCVEPLIGRVHGNDIIYVCTAVLSKSDSSIEIVPYLSRVSRWVVWKGMWALSLGGNTCCVIINILNRQGCPNWIHVLNRVGAYALEHWGSCKLIHGDPLWTAHISNLAKPDCCCRL